MYKLNETISPINSYKLCESLREIVGVLLKSLNSTNGKESKEKNKTIQSV